MRKILLPALAAAALAASAGMASAQSVGVGVYLGAPGPYWYDDDVAYGYVAAPEARVVHRRHERRYVDEPRARDHNGTCGTYFYWNGNRCVDARNR